MLTAEFRPNFDQNDVGEHTNYLHISSLAINGDFNFETNFLMGYWCLPRDELYKNNYKILCDSKISNASLIKFENYTSQVYKQCLHDLSNSLNEFHDVNYSLKFWEVLTSGWLTATIDQLHFYYKKILEIDALNIKFLVETDEKVLNIRISTVMENLGIIYDEYIHNMISFIIKNSNLDNIKWRDVNLIKKHSDLISELIEKRGSINNSFFKKLKWKLLDSNNPKVIIYGILGVELKEMIISKIFDFDMNIKYTYKNRKTFPSNYSRNEFKLNKDIDDEFKRLLYLYIEKSLPINLIENFTILKQEARSYPSCKVVIPSPGFYQDEQLIEIAFLVEHGAKLIQIETGDGIFSKVNSIRKVAIETGDKFLSFGSKNLNFNIKIEKTSSTLFSKNYNQHKEKYDNILYLASNIYIHGIIYNSDWIRGLEYVKGRVEFIKSINDSYIKEKLIVKSHQSRKYVVKDDDSLIMNSYDIKYNVYNNSNLYIHNCGIIYIDYLTYTIHKAMVMNTPTIMCMDYNISLPNDELKRDLDAFVNAGFCFHTPKEAADRVVEIYKDRERFWSSKEIQKVRNDFLNRFVGVSKEPFNDVLKKIKNMDIEQ